MVASDPAGTLRIVNLGLLVVLAALLFAPLLGLGRPPLWTVIALLAARLVLQVIRSRFDPALRRPGAWLLDVVLILLLVTQFSA